MTKRESAYRFDKVTDRNTLATFKKEWLDTLVSPQDGMWGVFRDNGTHWGIWRSDELIGSAVVDENNQLIHFYTSKEARADAETVFRSLVDHLTIKIAIVGTHDPVYLSAALPFARHLNVHTCLFRDRMELSIVHKEGKLHQGRVTDLGRICEFYHGSTGAPKDWLKGYLAGLLERSEVYYFENGKEIIGACEVRTSTSAPKYADIGMVVSPNHRQKGYGTFLLSQAAKIAEDRGKIPICSCEKENTGSLKSIRNCGFTSRFQLLEIGFDEVS